MTDLPLKGVKVVELSTYVAAPICGRMLCDLGAEVIKIEPPAGDVWRYLRRNVAYTPEGPVNAMFQMSNAGKKSVTLNLKDPSGMETFHRLLSEADIFLTNNRPGSLRKLGIDHDTICAKYPGIIYGLLTGYGEAGPDASKPGFDLVAFFSMSGFLADLSCTDNKYPVSAPTSTGDITSGMALLSGVLAALYRKKETGLGDYVAVSLYNTGLWVCGTSIMRAEAPYHVKGQISRSDMYPLATMYRCSDGEWVQVSIMDEVRFAPVFFNIIGQPQLIDDPRFATDKARVIHSGELFEIVEPIFLSKSSVEWLDLFTKADIVCSRLAHFADIQNSEQAWANDYLEIYTFPNGVTSVMPRSPVRLASVGVVPSSAAPELGENNGEFFTNS